MNKDVIYIDVEDDITAIISKVKASKEKIVALVPPKRVGVLQSAVNLRLLHRAATQGDKRLVLITNNHALMSLAASASLPVAKNLQTKPEIAQIAALEVDDDDIIDGNDLPIGDHASQAEGSVDAVVAGLAEPPKTGESPRKAKQKSGVKIPNFNTFRKKLILGIVGAILLIAFLVWAIVIAPHATVIVSAKTNNLSVNSVVSISDKVTTDAKKGTIKAVLAQNSEDKSVDFNATGTKNVGEKASGTVDFSRQSLTGTTVAAGTKLTTSGGLVFITDAAVTIPASTTGVGCFPTACPGTASVAVTAAEGGAKYNAASGSVSGAPSDTSANLAGPTSGGTDKTAKVVTTSDILAAKEQLVKGDSKAVQATLKASFKGGAQVIDDSFVVDYTNVKSTPDVGLEAPNGKAVLTSTINYRLYGVENDELNAYLDEYLTAEIDGKDDQRVYNNGGDKATIQDVTKTKNGVNATLVATAKIGPKLDEENIKNLTRGKKFGDIQETIQAIQGVENVDVKFFPFWTSSVPDDVKRISVEFKVNGSN